MPEGRRLVCGDFWPTLEAAFLRQMADFKERRFEGGMLVLVPTALLRNHLTGLAAKRLGGFLNVHFHTFASLSRDIAVPALASRGLRHLPNELGPILLRNAANETIADSYFGRIADLPGLAPALFSAITDLEEAGLDPDSFRASLKGARLPRQRMKKLSDLAAIWQDLADTERELEFFTSTDLLSTTAEELRRPLVSKRWAQTVVYGVYDFNRLQRDVIEALIAEPGTVVCMPYHAQPAFAYAEKAYRWYLSQGLEEEHFEAPDSEAEVPASLLQLRSNLFSEPGARSAESPQPQNAAECLKVVSTGNAPSQAREVVRIALQCLDEPVCSADIGVIPRTGNPAPRLVDEFRRAGIDPFADAAKSVADTPAGRSLLLLVELARDNLATSALFDFLWTAELKPSLFGNIHPSRAIGVGQRLASKAGVVEGKDEWLTFLDTLRGGRKKRDDAEAVDAFATFARELVGRISAIPVRSGWDDYAVSFEAVASWCLVASEGLAQALDVLRQLLPAARIADQTSIEEFHATLELSLSRRNVGAGAFGVNHPSITPVMNARGVTFDVVILPDMIEKQFPGVGPYDSVLTETDRRLLNRRWRGVAALRTAADRQVEERLLFRLCAAAAKKCIILAYRRLDDEGRPLIPSHFVSKAIESVSAGIEQLSLENYEGYERKPLSGLVPNSPEEALTRAEFDLALLLPPAGRNTSEKHLPSVQSWVEQLLSENAWFRRSWEAERQRWTERDLTPHDAYLCSPEARELIRRFDSPRSRPISPTGLETYLACPFQYFAGAVLGIEILEAPAPVFELPAVDRGAIVHEVLRRVYSGLAKAGNWKPNAALGQAVAEEVDAVLGSYAEESGYRGRGLILRVTKDGLSRALVEMIASDLETLAGFVPSYFELSFGVGRREEEADPNSVAEPIAFPVRKGLETTFRGRIDRVDVDAQSSQARVVDYKSGKLKRESELKKNGLLLQLPLYAFATQALLARLVPGVKVTGAAYRSIAPGVKPPELGDIADELERCRSVLETVVKSMEAGVFVAPAKDKRFQPCAYCDMEPVCGTVARAVFARKRTAPSLPDFLRE